MNIIKRKVSFRNFLEGYQITFPIFQNVKNMGIFDSEETTNNSSANGTLSSEMKFTRISNAPKSLYSDVRLGTQLKSSGASRIDEFRTYNGSKEFYPGYINNEGVKTYNETGLTYHWSDIYIGKYTNNDGAEVHVYGIGVDDTNFLTLKENQEGIVYQDIIDSNGIETVLMINTIGNDDNSEDVRATFKREEFMGITSINETESNIRIDRGNINALEKIMRLNEINGVDNIERYQNNFYEII